MSLEFRKTKAGDLERSSARQDSRTPAWAAYSSPRLLRDPKPLAGSLFTRSVAVSAPTPDTKHNIASPRLPLMHPDSQYGGSIFVLVTSRPAERYTRREATHLHLRPPCALSHRLLKEAFLNPCSNCIIAQGLTEIKQGDTN